jgi:HEAT repeat protein
MTRGLPACAVFLCALPAAGDNAVLTPPVISALLSIDDVPSKAGLDNAFGAATAADDLQNVAGDHTVDLGIELRAIRALPAYCPTPCGLGATAHDGLIALIDGFAAAQDTPQDLLRLRAAVEALGATRSKLATDVDELVPLFDHASRDVRATVARALGSLGTSAACAPLKAQGLNEPSPQVQNAINTAIQALGRCGN